MKKLLLAGLFLLFGSLALAHLPEAYWPPIVVDPANLKGEGEDIQMWPKYSGMWPYQSTNGTLWDDCFDEWGNGFQNMYRTAAIPGENFHITVNVGSENWDPADVCVLLVSDDATSYEQWAEVGWTTLSGNMFYVWFDDFVLPTGTGAVWRKHYTWSKDIELGERIYVQPAVYRDEEKRWLLGNVEALTFFDCRKEE